MEQRVSTECGCLEGLNESAALRVYIPSRCTASATIHRIGRMPADQDRIRYSEQCVVYDRLDGVEGTVQKDLLTSCAAHRTMLSNVEMIQCTSHDVACDPLPLMVHGRSMWFSLHWRNSKP